jgi:hypothetical protein
MPYPEVNEQAVLQYLLRRNLQMNYLHVAERNDTALYLVGRTPTDSMSPSVLDHFLGAACETTEEIFPTAMALGFGEAYRYRPIAGQLASRLQP